MQHDMTETMTGRCQEILVKILKKIITSPNHLFLHIAKLYIVYAFEKLTQQYIILVV